MEELEYGRLETRDLEIGMNEKEEYLQVPTSATTSSTARCIYAVSTYPNNCTLSNAFREAMASM